MTSIFGLGPPLSVSFQFARISSRALGSTPSESRGTPKHLMPKVAAGLSNPGYANQSHQHGRRESECANLKCRSPNSSTSM